MAWSRDEMAARAAQELTDGLCVSLGVGMPSRVADFVPDDLTLTLYESGLLRIGPRPGPERWMELAVTSTADSLAMVRGGHVDLAILGAMQVATNGDLANWMAPGKRVKGIGGAMDLVAGVRRVIIMMEHVERSGAPKLVERCTLPLTGRAVVDLVITELGVFRLDRGRSPARLVELAPGVSLDEVRARTGAAFKAALS